MARTIIGRGQVLVASGVKTNTRLFSYKAAGIPRSIISSTFSFEKDTETFLSRFQSFNAPMVNPWTMVLRTKKAKTETGSTMRVAAAPMPAQSIFP